MRTSSHKSNPNLTHTVFNVAYNIVIYFALFLWLIIIIKSARSPSIYLRSVPTVFSPFSSVDVNIKANIKTDIDLNRHDHVHPIHQQVVTFITSSPTFRVTSSIVEKKTLLVVLGNEPLDDTTPTIDTMRRVEVAVNYYKQHLTSMLIFSGGPTAGKTTEAKMMSSYAQSLGVPASSILLEEKARSTGENAIFVANMILERKIPYDMIYVVSKQDHLEWAMPMFKGKRTPGHVFANASSLVSTVTREESIEQMEKYLQNNNGRGNIKRIRMRLDNLRKGIKGID